MICKNAVLRNFPILEDDFDALTDYELFSKMVAYVKSIDAYVKTELDTQLKSYIDKRFNELMLDAMYDADTETLILYLRENES